MLAAVPATAPGLADVWQGGVTGGTGSSGPLVLVEVGEGLGVVPGAAVRTQVAGPAADNPHCHLVHENLNPGYVSCSFLPPLHPGHVSSSLIPTLHPGHVFCSLPLTYFTSMTC